MLKLIKTAKVSGKYCKITIFLTSSLPIFTDIFIVFLQIFTKMYGNKRLKIVKHLPML